jgi:hypothetical protein
VSGVLLASLLAPAAPAEAPASSAPGRCAGNAERAGDRIRSAGVGHRPERRGAFGTFVGVMRDDPTRNGLFARLPPLQDAERAARVG